MNQQFSGLHKKDNKQNKNKKKRKQEKSNFNIKKR